MLQELIFKKDNHAIAASGSALGERYMYLQGDHELLFTDNETNKERIFGTQNDTAYVKDGINNYIVSGDSGAVNPKHEGTKAAAHYSLNIGAGKTATIQVRLTDLDPCENRRSV